MVGSTYIHTYMYGAPFMPMHTLAGKGEQSGSRPVSERVGVRHSFFSMCPWPIMMRFDCCR